MNTDPLQTSGTGGLVALEAHSPAVNGADLIRMADTVTVEDVEFARKPDSPLIAEISEFTKRKMIEMNAAFPGLPPDTLERTRELLTCPGAHTVILRGVIPGERDSSPQLLGYGVVIKGVENFPDADHIPEYLRPDPGSCRVIRLFVSNESRQLMPHGEAFTRILDRVKEVGAGTRTIGMVLTDITGLKGAFDPNLSVGVWKDAQHALEVRGFEDTGESIVEKVTHADGREVLVSFRWYIYPPASAEGHQSMARHAERFAALEGRRQERIASSVSVVPGADSRVLVHASEGAFDFARVYPANMFIGVDYGERPPEAQERRANLAYQRPNDDHRYFANGSVNSVVVLGVLPDIARRNPNGGVEAFLRAQFDQLKPGGMLIIRDTVAPLGPETVRTALSPVFSRAFEKFLSGPREPHIPAEAWESVVPLNTDRSTGWRRYQLPNIIRKEFLLKEMYQNDWERERQRPFTGVSVDALHRIIEKLGARLMYSGPETSRYLQSRIDENSRTTDIAGNEVIDCTTNYVVIVEKVGPEEAVRFQRTKPGKSPPRPFLTVRSYAQKDPRSGETIGVREIGARKNLTHDVVGWDLINDRLFTEVRIFPRAVLSNNRRLLDGSRVGPYLMEQVAALVDPADLATPEAARASARRILHRRGGVPDEQIGECSAPQRYFTRPGAFDEEVIAHPVRIHGALADRELVLPAGASSDTLAPTVRLRMCDAQQILRGAQKGGYLDARAERIIYQLSRELGMPLGRWLGDPIVLETQSIEAFPKLDIEQLLQPAPATVFEPLGDRSYGFFNVRRDRFRAFGSDGKFKGEGERESLEPSDLSLNAVPVLPVMRCSTPGGATEYLYGVEIRDFPVNGGPTYTMSLATAPVYYLTEEVGTIPEAKRFVGDSFRRDFGGEPRQIRMLGGKFPSSPGMSAEFLYPMIVEVGAEMLNRPGLMWVPGRALGLYYNDLRCGILRTLVNRSNHAFGVEI